LTEKTIENWLARINATPNTRSTYIKVMRHYTEFLDKTMEEIVEEYIHDIKDGKLMPERRIFNEIPNFLQYMKQKGNKRTGKNQYAPNTVKVYKTALRSFFQNNYIEFPKMAKDRRVRPLIENTNQPLKREGIKEMIHYAANIRDSAIFITMATSGMASNEIRHLKISNVVEIDKDNIGTVRLRRDKVQHDYTTFFSPEATEYIRTYWEHREKILGRKLKKSDYVFVGIFEKNIMENRLIAERTFSSIFSRIGEKIGYERETEGGFLATHSHALRKFFSNTLEQDGMQKHHIDALLGHVPDSVDSAYFSLSEESLKKDYIKHLPTLTFKEELVVHSLEGEDAEKLTHEIAEIKNDYDELNREHKKTMDYFGDMAATFEKAIERVKTETMKETFEAIRRGEFFTPDSCDYSFDELVKLGVIKTKKV